MWLTCVMSTKLQTVICKNKKKQPLSFLCFLDINMVLSVALLNKNRLTFLVLTSEKIQKV